jgi:hypothetical protein
MYVHGSQTVDVRNILNMLAHDGTLGSLTCDGFNALQFTTVKHHFKNKVLWAL